MDEKIFQKKDIIFSETLGVCKIEDIVKLSADKINSYTYYVLKSIFTPNKMAYIPVEHHSVLLRELISKETAEKKAANAQKDNIAKENKGTEHTAVEKESDIDEEKNRLLWEEVNYVLGRS